MSSGIYHYKPGDEVDVEVVEDGEGNLPDRGDLVKAVGETADHVQVTGLEDPDDTAIAQMGSIPSDRHGDPTEGAAEAIVVKPITWVDYDGEVDVGDEVEESPDGVVEYGDEAEQNIPLGIVFQTVVREFGVGDKVAVARYR